MSNSDHFQIEPNGDAAPSDDAEVAPTMKDFADGAMADAESTALAADSPTELVEEPAEEVAGLAAVETGMNSEAPETLPAAETEPTESSPAPEPVDAPGEASLASTPEPEESSPAIEPMDAPGEADVLAGADGGLEGVAPQSLRAAVTASADPDQPLLDIRARRRGRPSVWALAALGAADVSVELTESVSVVPQQATEAGAEPGNEGVGDEDWTHAQELLDAQEVFETRVSGYNLGGVTTTFGRLRGFIPNSHLSMIQPEMNAEQQQTELSKLVGKTIPVRIIEVQRKRRRLVLSERLAERAWREKQRDRILSQIEVGQVVSGRVRSMTSFGVFVDIGGADGLIHLSELTWKRIKHPREVVKVGQELTMEVIRVERERGRVGLSLKRTQPNPWGDIEAHYHAGQLITARVTNLVSFGAFASVEPGVEGLVHISELSDDYIEHPRQVVQRGQEYTMRVLGIDREHERISLSLRQAPQWIEAPSKATSDEEMTDDG